MYKFFRQFSLVVALALAGMGCGHQRVRYDASKTQTSEVASGQGLRAHVNWLKVKGDKIDIELVLSNTSNEAIKISPDSLHLRYEGDAGMLNQHGDFLNSLAVMGPHSTRSGPAYFVFPHKLKKMGNATLTIDPVYAAAVSDPNMVKENWRKLAPLTLQLPVVH
jgi:hypothetical protein